MSAPPRVLTAIVHLLLGAGLALAGWDTVGHLRAVSLRDLVFADRGTPARRAAPRGAWTAALVFTPNECPGLMAVVDRLNELTDPQLAVVGILLVDEAVFPEWQRLIVANQIRFPVQAVPVDRGNRALAQVGRINTPTLAIFDSKRSLRLATNLTGEEELMTLLARIIRESGRETPSTRRAP